ncbi:hypothetical protein C8J57DRAFT_1254526 [Mycena rebaudengoi]|nr:hypothetical protein C8J57DRAFT_1254526 [Mycena rebaudengoi]
MSDEQNTVLATSLNPCPHTSRKICEAFTQPTLGPFMQCQNGSALNNWARCIPENVAIRFTLKKSAEEVGTSLLCDVSCLMNKNERRRANKECTRTIPKCAGCCRGAGGCNTPSHRVKHRDVPLSLLAERQPSSTQTSADPGSSASITENTNVIRRTFARPLDEGYAKKLHLPPSPTAGCEHKDGSHESPPSWLKLGSKLSGLKPYKIIYLQ